MSLAKTQSGGMTLDNVTLAHYGALFSDSNKLLEGLGHSLLIASAAAIVGLAAGAAVAYVLTYSQFRYKRFIETVSIITLAVPGVVLGIGYIFVWNQQWLEPIGLLLYGTPWILILASVAGAIPVITRVLVGAMAKVPASQLTAAQLQGGSFTARLRIILVPLIRGALLSAGLAAFGSGVFDLAVNSILFPPDFITLPVTINKAFEDLNFGYASAATVLGSGIVIIIIMALELLLRRKEARQ